MDRALDQPGFIDRIEEYFEAGVVKHSDELRSRGLVSQADHRSLRIARKGRPRDRNALDQRHSLRKRFDAADCKKLRVQERRTNDRTRKPRLLHRTKKVEPNP